jgi:hypothetical protein
VDPLLAAVKFTQREEFGSVSLITTVASIRIGSEAGMVALQRLHVNEAGSATGQFSNLLPLAKQQITGAMG